MTKPLVCSILPFFNKVFIRAGEIVYGVSLCFYQGAHKEVDKMKKVSTFCIVLSIVSCFALSAIAEDDCPYDDDYKYTLKKALLNYLKEPAASEFSIGEVKQMLNFYLKESSITNSECTEEIKALVEKADKVEDSVLFGAAGQELNRCNVCQDGTLCAEKNDKEQTCYCKDINEDNLNEYCTLKPIIAAKEYCEVCPDGTLCDGQNDKEQTCYCKDADVDGRNEHCYLRPLKAWSDPCDKCEDDTACNQTNDAGETCSCRDINSDGVTERCMLYADNPVMISAAGRAKSPCTKCPDNTACGKAKNKNLMCSCTDANNDGKYETCKLDKIECTQCSDATACGKANAYNQVCRCTDTDMDNRSEICVLMPSNTKIYKCSACIDGTACGQTSGSNLCLCNPEPHKSTKYYSCQLTPYCSGCEDGTECRQKNSDENACTCYNKIGSNIYQKCILECDKCEDGTECGKTGSDGKTCVCRWEGSKTGKYMECLSRCDKCSDGTLCYKKNKDNKYCLCAGIEFRSRKYVTCEIEGSNHTTTTIGTTTTTTTEATTTTSTTTTTIATTSTTLAPEEQLTASNLLVCIKAKKGKLYTDSWICEECADQKRVFINETDAPVGPGEYIYEQLAIEGASGTIPRWDYRLSGQDMTSPGCKSFQGLNELFLCGLSALPGHEYQEC
jgi:hypothetical protein